MKAIYLKTSALILCLGVSFSSFAENPCKPIAMDCMKEGYYKGGDKTGKGLIKDCVMPITQGQKSIANATYSPADVTACSAELAKKMENKAAQ